MSRIYERDTDRVFLHCLRQDVKFARYLLKCVGRAEAQPESVHGQTRHIGSGTIDLEIRYSSGVTLLIENKIDAGYSVSGLGIGQPERYRETVCARRGDGEAAVSVLLAPQRYLACSRSAALFDHCIAYERLIPLLADADREIIELAIEQAGRPYEPVKDPHASDFFQEYRQLVEERFSHLTMKKDPTQTAFGQLIRARFILTRRKHSIYISVCQPHGCHFSVGILHNRLLR
jgi:hypothetical protein